MNYIQILSCSSELGNCCNDTSVAIILDMIRKIISLIQIIAPILLIIMATIEFSKLVANPERKDGTKHIKNMFLSAAIIFFIPIIMDAVLNMMPQSFSVTACWNQAKTTTESSRNLNPEYIALNEKKKPTSILPNTGDYESGKPKENTSLSPGGSLVAGSAKGILEGAEKVHTMYEQEGWAYYTDLDQLRWEDINYSTNNPSKMTCCATFVGSAFLVGGVFTESEINEYNYNSQYGIDELCAAHGWTKITNYSNLAAGDIVIMTAGNSSAPGHVQIYAGNGTWYNAGSTQAIQMENPYSSDASARFLWAWRKTN